jgi:hypothetical protein
MIHWEAHACLPLHPEADFAPLDRLREAGMSAVEVAGVMGNNMLRVAGQLWQRP